MTEKFAQGPWVRIGDTIERAGEKVAGEHILMLGDRPDREANARAILALPEIVDTLDLLRAMLAPYAGKPGVLGEAYNVASSALAKATGEPA